VARALWLETHPLSTPLEKGHSDTADSSIASPMDEVNSGRKRRASSNRARRKTRPVEGPASDGVTRL
jgi:hypothetical protein